MGRILAIDYGTKRTGLAVTDPLQLIASALETIPTSGLLDFIEDYLEKEEVEQIVIGEPLHKDGSPTSIHHLVVGLQRKLARKFPKVRVVLHDEAFTSQDARRIILQSGAKKKKRREKGLVDRVSAGLILQDYLDSQDS